MARARKSHKSDEENTKATRSGLKPAYGQVGANPYVIYVAYRPEDVENPKILILNFAQKYSAKFFLDQLIAGDDYEWIDPVGPKDIGRRRIKTSFGLEISMYGDDLKVLLEYELRGEEAAWEDDQVRKHVARLKYGRTTEDRKRIDHVEDPDAPEEERVKGKKHKKEKKPKKEKKEKIDKTNLISANDIAKELEVEGREVRGVLRALKLVKPEGGWLFDKKTADEIREKVKKGLKEAKKKKGKK
jgi:hypothetical protein